MGLRQGVRFGLLVSLAGLVLSTGPAAAQRSSAGTTPAIEGPAWQLTEYRMGDSLTPVLPGLRADALFWAGNLTGFAGCSDFLTTYELDDARIDVQDATAATDGCDPETQAVQETFLADLARAERWSVDVGELTLLDPEGEPSLRFTAASVAPELTVAPWRLARVADEAGLLQPVVDGSLATARFLPGGRVVGSNGCAGFLGTYAADGSDVTISDLESRIGDCEPALAAQAERVIESLARAVESEVTPAGLTLLDADGRRLLAWVPAPALAGTLWTPTIIPDPDTGTPQTIGAPLRTMVLAFGTSGANGRTHCRPWRATYRRSGLALTFDDIAFGEGTRCKPFKPEKAFMAALGQVASYALRRSGMDLLDAQGRTVLRFRPQDPLTGVQWQLTGIDRTDAPRQGELTPPLERTRPTAYFAAEDGLVSGTTGCNDYVADFETSGVGIDVSRTQAAGRSCGLDVERQEDALLAALEAADTFVVLGNEMRLLQGNRILLTFERTQ